MTKKWVGERMKEEERKKQTPPVSRCVLRNDGCLFLFSRSNSCFFPFCRIFFLLFFSFIFGSPSAMNGMNGKLEAEKPKNIFVESLLTRKGSGTCARFGCFWLTVTTFLTKHNIIMTTTTTSKRPKVHIRRVTCSSDALYPHQKAASTKRMT